jgi:hypothetical protein
MKRGNEVVPHVLFLIAAAVLLRLAGCANQGAPLNGQGKPLSGYVRLTQAQVAYLGSYIGNGEPNGLVGEAQGERMDLFGTCHPLIEASPIGQFHLLYTECYGCGRTENAGYYTR